MKKIVAYILALIWLVSCACSANAEEMDERLRAVTALVKERCGISDRYTEFYGEGSANGEKMRWYLNWSDEQGSLSVTCDEDGFPYSYYVSEESWNDYDPYYAPAVPRYDLETCRSAAEAFLRGALREGESYRLNESTQTLSVHDTANVTFSGIITRAGLDTDIGFSVQVNPETIEVSSFWRNDQWTSIIREDAADAETLGAQSAEKILENAIRMELEYVLDGESNAVLHYLPKSDGDYTLRAVTGELHDWNTSAENEAREYASAADGVMTAETVMSAGLTDAEIAGSEKLKGALTQAQLDEVVRAITELGVTDAYTLRNVRYSVKDERVTATLRYIAAAEDTASYETLLGMNAEEAKLAAEEGTTNLYRNVTVDAMTGALISCNAYGGVVYGVSLDALADDAAFVHAQEIADAFLAKYASDYAAHLRVERMDSQSSSEVYCPRIEMRLARVENDIPFRQDGANITINVRTGVVDSYSLEWTDGMTFESNDGVIGEEAAYAAYCEAVSAKRCWHAIPVSYENYEQQHEMALCYDLVSEPRTTAIGAKDGAVIADKIGAQSYDYSDVTGTAANQLAAFGVGIPGERFMPEQLITWREAAALLVQLDGTNAWSLDDEMLILYARNNRINVDQTMLESYVMRGDFVKTLLDMSGYGRAAAISGAYRTDFTDAEALGEMLGYAALAEAMQIAAPNESGAFSAEAELTRAQAAEMIWRFVNR